MQRCIVGLMCLSVLGNSIPVIETTPVASSFVGNAGSVISLRSNRGEHAEFGEGIRDWFRNVKNRIFGGTNDQQLPVETGKMMELEDKDLQDQKHDNPGGFFLDLSNLSFDPANDWGFRLGHWYFIKKSYNVGADDWNTSQPNYPDWPMAEGRNENAIPPLIIIKPNNDETTEATTVTSEETPEIQQTELPKVNNTENETENSKDDNRSTEVLLPSI